MVLVDPGLGVKIMFLLGLTNLISMFLVFFSCRCMVGINFVNKMFKYKCYQKYYSKHCYYWWIFFTSVILHVILGFLVFGIPFKL